MNHITLGSLLIVSGASGSGKTTLCRRATDEGRCVYSISCTTRAPRDGEKDGIDYHFLTQEEFLHKVEAGDFLEHAYVHGNYYGTLKSELTTLLSQGTNIVMDIDVQGADQVRTCTDPIIKRTYADLYIFVPQDQLCQRLTLRGTDDDSVISLRMANAVTEDKSLHLYQYVITSSTKDADYHNFQAILQSLSLRTSLMQ